MALYEPFAVGLVANLVISGFGADSRPTPMSAKELSSLMRPIEELRSALPTFPPVKVPDTREPIQEGSFTVVDSGRFVRSFTGWTRLTLDCVFSLPGDFFSLAEMYAVCTPVAIRCYPRNRHVPDKNRQPFQRLRDFGLVEFLGDGRYRRMVVS